MRSFLILISCCFIFASSVAQKPKSVVIKTKIYCDHCRQCETCGFVFLKTLPFESGIKKVELDEKEMTLTVLYNPKKISPEKIRIAISKLGYDADDIPADPKAYENLDGCCKK
jgi:hypothetical protein